MVRRVLQALVLPLFAVGLSAGGDTTVCAVLSTFGIEAHHHLDHGDECGGRPGALCHEAADHGHDHEPVRCPESCELKLSDSTAPAPLKLPGIPAAWEIPNALEFLRLSTIATSGPVPRRLDDPPDRGQPLHAPTFTGRFLI